jgi:hypothetical protein
MRNNMWQCVRAFDREAESPAMDVPGDLGLTVRFLAHTSPRQAILSGTTAFRLDRLSAYLSEHGSTRYFHEGLGRTATATEAKLFADELLDEVLGSHAAPTPVFRNHGEYIQEVFAIPENRERANFIYVSLLEQTGRFWGTVLAFRGYSDGESFVARNVGLKSSWKDGQWRVAIIFMDHDALSLPAKGDGSWDLLRVANGVSRDRRHIQGRAGPYPIKGEIGHLQDIYRVNVASITEGDYAFRHAMQQAYCHTQEKIRTDAAVRRLFKGKFLARYFDWDDLIAYLRFGTNLADTASATAFLHERGYSATEISSHIKALKSSSDFLRDFSFLYDTRNRVFSCS